MATVNTHVVGVGVGKADAGEVWSSLPPARRGSPGAGGTMVRPFAGRARARYSAAVQ